jgi:outer membrane receptor protein involved in Fe transport
VQHDLLAGWEHQNYRTRTTRSNAASVETTPIDLYEPSETHVPHTDFSVSRYDHTGVISHSAYAQDTMALGDRVKIVVGGRYDHLRRRQNNNPVNDGIETAVDPTRRTSQAFTSRAGLVYQPAERVDLYAQHATGFRPNYNLQPDGSTIEPETSRQFEVGQRLRLADARAEIHAALFHIEKRHIALSRPGGVFDLAGGIRSRGAEAELDLRPTARSRVSIGYGFTDAEYVDYVTAAADFSGRARPRSPRLSVTASASLAFDNGIGVAANLQSRGRQFLNDANTLALDGYALLNVSGSYTRGTVQLALTLSNVTATDYWASTLGDSQFYPGEPLRALVSVRIRTH